MDLSKMKQVSQSMLEMKQNKFYTFGNFSWTPCLRKGKRSLTKGVSVQETYSNCFVLTVDHQLKYEMVHTVLHDMNDFHRLLSLTRNLHALRVSRWKAFEKKCIQNFSIKYRAMCMVEKSHSSLFTHFKSC